MLSERIREQIEWPGRPVRGEDSTGAEDGGGEADEEGPESDISTSMIDPSRGEELAQQLSDADERLREMENEALKEVDRQLEGGDLSDRPQTQEAVRYLAGTHPDFQERDEPLSDADKLEEDGRLTGAALRRGYDTLEHADRNAFRMDLKDEVGTPDDEGVTRYQQITSPAEAAGERAPGREDVSDSMPAALEKSSRERQAGMGKKAFWLVGSFLLKALGKGVRKIAQGIENAFQIGIPGTFFTLKLGKFISKPLHMIADWLLDMAERLMEKVFGYDPADREPPEDQEVDGGVPDENISGGVDRSKLPGSDDPSLNEMVNAEPEAGPDTPGLGMRMLQAGHQVVKATAEEAERREDDGLARAVGRYDQARVLRRDLEAHKEIATAWGVPVGSNQDNAPPGDGSQTPTSPTTTDDGTVEKC